jgi:hypothetical protein
MKITELLFLSGAVFSLSVPKCKPREAYKAPVAYVAPSPTYVAPSPDCVPGDMCVFGTVVFSQDGGLAANTPPANCHLDELPLCASFCNDHCLNGEFKTDLSPLAQATCDGFECPECVKGNTCKVGMEVFNTVDGQIADTPVHCLITDLDPCSFECSSDNCFNGALKTDLSALVIAACATFDCSLVDCLGFECYLEAINTNTEYGNSIFLGPGLAIQGKPWFYDYDGVPGNKGKGFQLGMSGNGPWGGTSAVDGVVYAIFQGESSIEQTLSGLVSEERYVISWYQQGRTNHLAGNDINFSYGGLTIYTEKNIVNTSWESKSAEFTASVDGILKIWSTNPLGLSPHINKPRLASYPNPRVFNLAGEDDIFIEDCCHWWYLVSYNLV